VSADRHRIPPQTGVGFRLAAGARLRVIDPLGEQVSDLYAVNADDLTEHVSSGRSIDYADRLWLSTGDILYSGRSRPMLRIVSDSVGRHDFTLTPCAPETFDLLYPEHEGYHPSCFENLVNALSPYGVEPGRIGTSFNTFMNVSFDPATGAMTIGAPLSRPGDDIVLLAEMDLYVGLTACSAEKSNNGTLKPIDYEVLAP
jgi:uncharacterized protein YcgI (DUF1989 family)